MGRGRARGRAAWRALDDVDVTDVDASAARAAAGKTNEALFYIDDGGGGGGAKDGVDGVGKGKTARARARALKIDGALIKAAPGRTYPTPVAMRATKRGPPPGRAAEATKTAKTVTKMVAARKARGGGKKNDDDGVGAFDVWASKAPKARGINKAAKKLTAPTTNARAVTHEHSGCSFNPPKDAREDVVAVALAKEFKAKQAKYLDPVTVPVSNAVAARNMVNELYFESGFGDDESDEEGDGGGRLSVNPAVKNDKLSKSKRNKLKRRQEAEAEAEANRKAKQLRHELSNLKALKKEIETEEAERQAKLARRNAVRAERRASQPARLGKHRHTELDADVRFADELDGGSLRTLKGNASLLHDRLKSYERRELIEPRRKVERKKASAVIKYEPGARGERELELNDETTKTRERIVELKREIAAREDADA